MGYFCENSKYFRDMVIQSFLNMNIILVIFANLFSGIWNTFQNTMYLKGYGIPGNFLPVPQHTTKPLIRQSTCRLACTFVSLEQIL